MKHRLLKTIAIIGTGLLSFNATAELIQNGDFSADFGVVSGPNFYTYGNFTNNDQWVSKNANGWDWNSGVNNAVTGISSNFSFAQAVSIGAHTGDEYRVALDWTPAGGAPDLEFHVVAWKFGTNALPDDRMFNGLNFFSDQSRQVGAGGSFTDLFDGSVHTGNANVDFFSVAGSGHAEFNLNLGGDNIEDFDAIGIRFRNGATAGSILDNVSIDAGLAIPEPSSLFLLGSGALALLGSRRRKKQLSE